MTEADAQKDMCRIIDDLPIVFMWEGKEYVGTRGPLVTTDRILEGGMFTEPTLSITVCRKKLLAGRLVDRFPTSTLPECGARFLHVGGKTNQNFRVMRVTEDEYSAAVQFDLDTDADAAREQSSMIQGGNFSGTGDPNGTVTAGPGAIYVDVSNGDRWHKTGVNTGDTGWVKVIG